MPDLLAVLAVVALVLITGLRVWLRYLGGRNDDAALERGYALLAADPEYLEMAQRRRDHRDRVRSLRDADE